MLGDLASPMELIMSFISAGEAHLLVNFINMMMDSASAAGSEGLQAADAYLVELARTAFLGTLSSKH